MMQNAEVTQAVPQPRNFEELFAAEQEWRHTQGETDQSSGAAERFHGQPQVAPGTFTEAPRVTFANEDCVGLAFSGGGIRSATFNLGILQGLHHLRLLAHFDYLSTVSGGGYIGAWWSAWLARRTPTPAGKDPFPKTSDDDEPAEVRHLREFSNFLAPRIGIFESESWAAVLAVLSAMVPALIVALAIIAAGELVWLGLARLTVQDNRWLAVGVALAIAFVVELSCELKWCSREKAENCSFGKNWIFWTSVALLALLATAGILWGVESMNHRGYWERLLRGFGVNKTDHLLPFKLQFFFAPLAWTSAALAMFVPRILILRFLRGDEFRARINTIDRVLQRLLACATLWTVVAGVWLAGAWLSQRYLGGAAPAAGGALLSGGAFALLREWFVEQLSTPRKGGFADALKPMLPQLLAVVALLSTAICVAAAFATALREKHNGFYAVALLTSVGVIAFAAAFFDPALVSMHAFYRNRLARAYLGASNKDALSAKAASLNRHIDVRTGDDILMRDLLPTGTGAKRGPLHLICCAANDIAGDQLGNLARASRSAVLSPLGFQIGDHWRAWNPQPSCSRTCIDRLTLSSAITASAAAFNSNMGSLSASLGTVVCFLMSALNLRLGLWLPHPGSDKDDLGWFPGALFLREMFGLTESGVNKANRPNSRFVHLSDGAHFENLALYELVRRHCRYILLSDCGADAETAFDDFGNAVRRIREDFGVEIEIDLDPLRPDEARRSRQHAVVGNIFYDREKNDTGVLIYFKPTLTGDEPGDVTQYRTRNMQFPHESTGDQFYDEAQWESYRRLGEHSLGAVFRFLERLRKKREEFTPEDIFLGARLEWYPAPADLEERLAQTSGRVAELEQRLRTDATPRLQREIFPELGEMEPKRAKGRKAAQSFEELHQDLVAMLAMARAMEDAWLSCYLDTHWNHPLNLGWINLFQRWAYAPTFRFWWPLMKTRHSGRFRRFLEEHFDLDDKDYPPITKTIGAVAKKAPAGFAMTFWERSRDLNRPRDIDPNWEVEFYPFVFELMLQKDETADVKAIPLQVAIARIERNGDQVKWDSNDFYVPPGLWGSGIGSTFLSKLLKKLAETSVKTCRVKLQPPSELDAKRSNGKASQRSDIAGRQAQAGLIAFYKNAGFRLQKDAADWMIWSDDRNSRES